MPKSSRVPLDAETNIKEGVKVEVTEAAHLSFCYVSWLKPQVIVVKSGYQKWKSVFANFQGEILCKSLDKSVPLSLLHRRSYACHAFLPTWGGTRHKPKNVCVLRLVSCQEWSNVRKVSYYQNATNPETKFSKRGKLSRRPTRNERIPHTVRIFVSGCLLSSVIYKGISASVQNSLTGLYTLKRKSAGNTRMASSRSWFFFSVNKQVCKN